MRIYFGHSYQSNRIIISEIYVSTKEAIGLDVLHREINRIVFCSMLVVIMLVLLAMRLLLKFYDLKTNGVTCIFVFVLLSCIWLFTDSSLFVLGKWKMQLICLISFYSFLLMPIPLNSFLATVCGRRSKLLTLNKFLLWSNCLVQSIFYLIGIWDFSQMLPVTHLTDGVVIMNILIFMYSELKHKRTFYPKVFLGGSAVFSLLSITAIVSFYLDRSNYALWYQAGIVIFTAALISMAFKHIQQIFQEYNQTEVYKQIAYIDSMTQVRNRAAYEKKIIELRDILKVGQKLIVLMMDLNGLKQTNDYMGHGAGDELICGGAECIRRTIGVRGEIYRIGGDEFVVFIVDPKIEQDYEVKLEQIVDEYNSEHEIKLSIAIGVAESVRYDMSTGWVRSVVEDADKEMYRHKHRQKHSRNISEIKITD